MSEETYVPTPQGLLSVQVMVKQTIETVFPGSFSPNHQIRWANNGLYFTLNDHPLRPMLRMEFGNLDGNYTTPVTAFILTRDWRHPLPVDPDNPTRRFPPPDRFLETVLRDENDIVGWLLLVKAHRPPDQAYPDSQGSPEAPESQDALFPLGEPTP